MNDLFPETLINGAIQLANITIRRDEAGRYCLNDLHKASGGNGKNRPSLWLANKRTKALIAEFLSRNSCSESGRASPNLGLVDPVSDQPKPGPSRNSCLVDPVSVDHPKTGSPSTYVIKPLVYAYAAWVSPAFDRLVYEVFEKAVAEHVKQLDGIQQAFRQNKPHWFQILENNHLPRAEIIKITHHKSPGSITANRRRMRECGLLPERNAS